MRFNKIISIICALGLVFSMSTFANANMITDSEVTVNTLSHIHLDAFDGYESHEVNPKGRVGYNLAFSLPNGETVKLGFDPRNSGKTNAKHQYSIADGWYIKLPFFDNCGYHSPEGYLYEVDKNNTTNNLFICNYPSDNQIILENSETEISKTKLCVIEPYDVKNYFNNGYIVKTLDTFAEETNYEYYSGKLSKIFYPDDSYVSIYYDDDNVVMSYSKNNITTVFADLLIEHNVNGFNVLKEVIETNGINVTFDYVINDDLLLLASYNVKDKYRRTFNYENIGGLSRATLINTVYDDGDSVYATYKYDNNGNICSITKPNAVAYYNYSVSSNGDLIIDASKTFQGEQSVYKDIYNERGQLTMYSYAGNTLRLQYNSANRIVIEKENDIIANYAYDDNGLLSCANWSNGNVYNYSYTESGELLSYTVTQADGVVKTVSQFESSPVFNTDSTVLSTKASGISVLYNINSSVSVLNWHTYYGLKQNSFNCYSYSIGKAGQILDPGEISGNTITSSGDITLSKMKKYTELDQEKLGRDIYDSTVSETHNSHAWKIALRVSPGYDYHFMKRSYNSTSLPSHWEFKAGKGGPVMRLRNSKTPSDVTWDMYIENTSTNKYVVYASNVYTSSIKYMIIQD